MKAAEWYRLAARGGDRHALSSLGLMALDGRGMAKDPARAGPGSRRRPPRASRRPPTTSPCCSSRARRRAELPRAVELLRRAADAEIADAQHALGVLYLKGRGVDRDPAEAARWFERAARNGSLAGEVEYAILLFNGEGVPANEAEAARAFRRAAAKGNAIAQNRLARLLRRRAAACRQNKVEAAAWHLMAAAQGLADPWLDDALKDLSADERARAERLAAERSGLQLAA